MSVISINPPYPVFADNEGEPLDGGLIYIGGVNLNPLILTNQLAVYTDAALTIPTAQPIGTINGYPVSSGSPTRLYVGTADYSIVVLNRNRELVYSSPSNKTKLGLIDLSTDVTGFLPSTLVEITASAAELAAGVVIVNKYIPRGYVTRYGAIGNNVADDTTAFQAAMNQACQIGGDDIIYPPPSVAYLITAPITQTVVNRPVAMYGSGWGWTLAGAFTGGCWINFNCATVNAKLFNFAGKIEGFDASGFGVRLAQSSKNQRAFYFAEVLEGNLDTIRFEGNSTALDTNTAIEFGDPIAIGGVFSGNFNITRCLTTGIQRGVRIAANCTTIRINGNEFYGNNPASASTIGISVATNSVGVNIINNTFQGWATTGIDDDGTTTVIAFCYFENNGTCYDRSGASLPMGVANRIVTGGAPVFPATSQATIDIRPRNFKVDDTSANFGLGYQERYRSFIMGEFPTYTPTYTASGAMTFTAITAGTVQGSTTLLRYNVYGKDTVIDYRLDGTAGGVASTEIRFSLPAGFDSPTGRVQGTCLIFNAGGYEVGQAEIRNGEAFVRVSRLLGGTWTLGAVGCYGRIGYFANN